jgi:ABC-type glutathione transport system ATPase component
VHEKLAVLDLRNEETIYATNRFMIYALFPQTNISIHVLWGVQKQNTVFATGKSILDRSSRTNIGELMLSSMAAAATRMPAPARSTTRRPITSCRTRRFGKLEAVKNVSLDIESGQFFTLLGPSGCGKTTILRMIAGFDQPDEGELYLDGQSLAGIPPESGRCTRCSRATRCFRT